MVEANAEQVAVQYGHLYNRRWVSGRNGRRFIICDIRSKNILNVNIWSFKWSLNQTSLKSLPLHPSLLVSLKMNAKKSSRDPWQHFRQEDDEPHSHTKSIETKVCYNHNEPASRFLWTKTSLSSMLLWKYASVWPASSCQLKRSFTMWFL